MDSIQNRSSAREPQWRLTRPSALFTAALLLACVLLQYKLWFSDNGLTEYWRLKQTLQSIEQDNEHLRQRNEGVAAEIKDLKEGKEAIEERARNDLGLIKPDEIFYQVLP